MTDNITLPRATVQQALEALEELDGLDTETECVTIDVGDVMDALRAALEQQQAEPVGEVTAAVDGAFKCEFSQHLPVGTKLYTAPRQQAESVQEPFDDLATELFVVAQRSPADDGFSDTIDRIESWLREHFSTQPQRNPLTDEEIEQAQRDVWRSLPSDFDYTTSSWIEIGIRYAEAAHGIKEGT